MRLVIRSYAFPAIVASVGRSQGMGMQRVSAIPTAEIFFFGVAMLP